MRLDKYTTEGFRRGRPAWLEAIWVLLQPLSLSSSWPGSRWRVALLRLFGARIGRGVTIKPGVVVKFPWRLTVGNHSWLGEKVWVDNLAEIQIGDHCCISQDVYLCTGSHDWRRSSFNLLTKPITIGDEVWLAARSVVGPGVTVGSGAVLALGSVATADMGPWSIYRGSPAVFAKPRRYADAKSGIPG